MKKLILGIALACFIVFGTVGVQQAVASVDNVEIVKLQLDDDPDKNKKAEAKTDEKKSDKKCSDKKCCAESKAKCKTESQKCEKKCTDKKKTEGGDGGEKK